MYFPYLYGRQAELAALCDVAVGGFGAPQQIIPLIEPAAPANKLKRALAKFKAAGVLAYLVVNPSLHQLATPGAQAQWSTDIGPEVTDAKLVRPTLKERPGTSLAHISAFVAAYPGRDLGLVVTSNKLAASDVAKALSGSKTIVFLLPGVDPLGYVGQLGASKVVTVSDNFPQQARNADYAGEEWLASNHLTYVAAGQPGFSDFTVLPGPFSASGGPVGAVAFHLTFKQAGGEFWIQHFVSDERTQYVSTAQAKLLEAIKHLETQIAATPSRFVSSTAIANYLNQLSTGSSTNLTNNKRLQIVHHLSEVAGHLGI